MYHNILTVDTRKEIVCNLCTKMGVNVFNTLQLNIPQLITWNYIKQRDACYVQTSREAKHMTHTGMVGSSTMNVDRTVWISMQTVKLRQSLL